jgi:hypothetical protein
MAIAVTATPAVVIDGPVSAASAVRPRGVAALPVATTASGWAA